MRIGAHVFLKKTALETFEYPLRIGCETFQMFPSNPRSWKISPKDQFDPAEFRRLKKRHDVHPVVLHMPYLINLASGDSGLREKSRALLLEALVFGRAIDAEFYVIHPGSHTGTTKEKGLVNLTEGLADVIDAAAPCPKVLLENCAGQGNCLGARWNELGQVRKALAGRIGFCLDTAHAWAAGYDVREETGFGLMMDEIEKRAGLRYIYLVHANDAKSGLGSRLDRHENLGRGRLGAKGLDIIVRNEVLGRLPFILETPKCTAQSDLSGIRFLRLLGERHGKRKKAV
jgi:deoxyribonuclease IV